MATTLPMITPGRILFILGNIAYSGGAFLADWNETHIHNPKWPPHARFHNGQTMSLGVCLASASLYFALRPSFSNSPFSPAFGALAAAAIGSFYCFAGMTAILYPGTLWTDPEFGTQEPQKYLFSSIIALMWVAYALEARRLGTIKGKTA